MHELYVNNSPKIDQAAVLLGEGDIINAIKLWREAMEKRGKCTLFCERDPASCPIHVCAVCFEGGLWNEALYAQGDADGKRESLDHLSLAQKIRDWLLLSTHTDT